jgi:hypothetical protein
MRSPTSTSSPGRGCGLERPPIPRLPRRAPAGLGGSAGSRAARHGRSRSRHAAGCPRGHLIRSEPHLSATPAAPTCDSTRSAVPSRNGQPRTVRPTRWNSFRSE